MPKELKNLIQSSLPVMLAVSLSACGSFRSNESSGTPLPAPTESPRPLSAWELTGINIVGPRTYPDGQKYIVFLDPKLDGSNHNSGDIANALKETFNPQANANLINLLGQVIPSQAPECFSTSPNAYGNFDVIPPCADQYVILDESVIETVKQALPNPTATPNWPATLDAAIVASATAIHLTDQP